MNDDKQCSLFDEPTSAVAIILPTHNLDELRALIELVDGEPRILDIRLAAWLGYDDVRAFRQLIKRHIGEFARFGILSQRVTNSGRRGRPGISYYLNQRQTNHGISYCGLPNLSELRVLVTEVFSAWQEGNLVSTNAETTIRLQDAAETAEQQHPGSVALGAEMAKLDDRMNARFDGVEERLQRVESEIHELQLPVLQAAFGRDATCVKRAAAQAPGSHEPRAYVDPETGEVRTIPSLAKPRSQ